MKKEAQKPQVIDQSLNRTFSEEFKRQRVKEIVTKKVSIRDVSELYGVSRTAVYKWVYRYSEIEKGVKTVVQMESEAAKTAYYKARLSELERMYGQKQMEVDLMAKILELASEEVGYDLKKKFSPERLSGFAPTHPNTDAQ